MAARIDDQIQRLGDPDPTVRHAASDQLVAIGAPARPAVQKAARDGDPQLSDAARETLGILPWFDPNDPPQVIELLKGYGAGSTADRIGIVGRLGAPEIRGDAALFRLLTDELNEDVCWQVAAELLRGVTDPDILLKGRRLDPAAAGSAAVYFSGISWLTPVPTEKPPVDRPRGRALLARSIELEAATPSYDNGLLDSAFDELVGAALDADQPTEAIRLRRLQCKRIGVNRDAFPSPFFALLSIYAQYGPLPGLQQVLDENDRFVTRPESLAILSRLYRKIGKQSLASTCEQLSITVALTPATQDLNGMFLDTVGFDDLAAAQSRAILRRGDAIPDSYDIDARERLARIATKREDDATALQQLQYIVADGNLTELNHATIRETNVEIAEHELRLARKKPDADATASAEAKLLALEANGTDSTIELVPLLHAQSRDDEAASVFDATYQPMRKRLDEGDNDPSLLNELAWLCAKCDRHLPDALNWSRLAVEGRPTSAAYLDTCAEVNSRLGHPAESVKMETRALGFEPGDLFMLAQLERYKAAAATQPAERH